jgi:ribonuclease R
LDPHQQREAKKYANPIPSREFILQTLSDHGAPQSFEEVAQALSLTSEEDVTALERRLGAMVRDGQLLRNRVNAFCLVNSRDLIAGRVIGHPDGFGFVKPDAGGDDLYLYPKEMRGLFHGDRVVVRVTGRDRRGRLEGGVVEILERKTHSVVGRLYQEGGVGFVVPDNKRLTHEIVIPRDRIGEAQPGQIVVAEVTDQPTKRTQPIGRVVQVLGDHMAAGMETDIAIRTHNLSVDWPEEVLGEIAALTEQVPEEAKAGRTDLRKLPLVTIDGADARDFDDAVYCEPTPKGWKLLVCIADVSAYVRPGTALDREARERGNSVYFPDRVIPMLPEVLSNGLCSINPQVDRLCMACEILFNAEGTPIRSRFFEGVMRSQARLIYEDVAAALDGDPGLCERYAEVLPHLHNLYALYKVLHQARAARGAIDFDTTETRFKFAPDGRLEAIVPTVRNDAHRLIEECMLAANVATARQFERKRMPGIYRIHKGPTPEKLSDLREFLAELALTLGGGDAPSAEDYAKLLNSIRERPDRHMIQTVLLRSMQQAVYSSENIGHFGLAFPAYTHFTSPIRRYPDLIVHRIVKHILTGGTPQDLDYSQNELQAAAEHCSGTERRADEATRDAESWLKCEYMQDKLGAEFDGTITSVTSFGIFVELDEVYVDGLVHITALHNDYYHFDPIGHRLTGERSGNVYRLGDRLRVQVAMVNLDERKIDFVLVASALTPKSGAKGSGKGAAKPSVKPQAPEPGQAKPPVKSAAAEVKERAPVVASSGLAPGGPDAGALPAPEAGSPAADSAQPRSESESQEEGGGGRRRRSRSRSKSKARDDAVPAPGPAQAPAAAAPVAVPVAAQAEPVPQPPPRSAPKARAQGQPDAEGPGPSAPRSRRRGEPEVAALTSWPRSGEPEAPAAQPAPGKGRRGRREPEVAALMVPPPSGREQKPAPVPAQAAAATPADTSPAAQPDEAQTKSRRRRRKPAKPAGD